VSRIAFRKLSVLIPVVGPAPDIARVHQELGAQLAELGLDHEVMYLVGTGDHETIEEVARLARDGKAHTRVLRFGETVGEAAMLSTGSDEAEGELIVTLPPRLETDLAALPALVEAVAAGDDLVIATRKRRASGNAARRQSELFNRLISWAAGSSFHDIASSTRAFRREVLREVPLYGDFHRYLPILAHRAGFRVREIPVDQHADAKPPRVHRPFLYVWRVIDLFAVFFIARFTRHPLRLFGGVGSVFAIAGGLLLAVLAAQRLLGTPLANRPLLVLATLLVGLGVQAFTIGLLGELLLFFHARSLRDYRIAAVYSGEGGLREHPPQGNRPPTISA
jgi:hypothetical protein